MANGNLRTREDLQLDRDDVAIKLTLLKNAVQDWPTLSPAEKDSAIRLGLRVLVRLGIMYATDLA